MLATRFSRARTPDGLEHFSGMENDLLAFDILNDDVEKVIAILKGVYKLKSRHYRHVGKTKGQAGQARSQIRCSRS